MRKELVFVLLALFLCAGCNGNKKKMNGEHDLDAANITLDDHTISFYYNWYGNPSVDGEMKHWMHPIALAPGHSGDVGAISGLGKTNLCSIISILFTSARIPLAMILGNTSMGLNGIWWAFSSTTIIKGIIFTGTFFWIIKKYPKNMNTPSSQA